MRLRYEFTVRRQISLLFFTIYFLPPHRRCPAPWARRILVRPAFFLHYQHVLYTHYTYVENTIIIFRATFSSTKQREKIRTGCSGDGAEGVRRGRKVYFLKII